MSNEINSQNIMSELNNIKNWKRTRKKSYEVYICRPVIGTKVFNKLENANYTTDTKKQFVVSGTVGEQWVIDINKLAKTYCTLDNQPITPEYLKKRMVDDGQIDWIKVKTITGADSQLNWAFHLPLSIKNFPVQTSWGDTLYANRPGRGHGQGDFLVCSDAGGYPNLKDVWVVNGLVFSYTYDMRAFPNLAMTTNNTTPVPGTLLKSKDNIYKPLNNQAASVDYTKPIIMSRLMSGHNIIGYVLKFPDGSIKNVKQQQVIDAVQQKKIGNAVAGPNNQGMVLLGKNFDDLPVTLVDKQQNGSKEQLETTIRGTKITLLGNVEASVDNSKPLVIGCIKDTGNNIVGVTVEFNNSRKDMSLLELIGLMSDGYNKKTFEIGNLSFKKDLVTSGNTGYNYKHRFLLRGMTWSSLECKQA